MNHFLIGTADKTERLLQLAGDHFLLIDDGPIADAFLEALPCRLFDIAEHSFNPLRGMDTKRARDISQALYTASPEGKDTLTVRNGRRALTRALLGNSKRFDKLQEVEGIGADEALATVDDMLLSPVMRDVLCRNPNFNFKGGVVVKLDRAEIGDFDAFLLASFLIGQFKGHVIVPDGGFYMREFYSTLIRQDRLTVCATFLSELSPKLQQMVLSIKDISGAGCVPDDAERLLQFTRHMPNTNGHADLLQRLIATEEYQSIA